MAANDLLYIGHMLDMARKAAQKSKGVTREQFRTYEDLQIILTHLIQVIGEAASRVSKPFREANPQIPWRAIIGMRHKVVHDYMAVDLDRVWDTVSEELPSLIAELEKLLPPEG